jgi:hypothetical protein
MPGPDWAIFQQLGYFLLAHREFLNRRNSPKNGDTLGYKFITVSPK